MIIFLADDDEDDRVFFSEALNEIPLQTEVTEFNNGVELMAGLHSNSPLPAAIFLDLKMPLMDGFECLADIRDVAEFKEIPVIIYSTSVHASDIKKLKDMLATRYLKKPTTYNQLKTLLYNCLNQLTDKTATDQDFVISE